MLKLFYQLVRFAGIGFLNTAASFAILNTLMFYTGIFKGTAVGIFAVVAFLLAVLHSYFWNKYWAFDTSNDTGSFFGNLGEFVVAAVLGAAILLGVVFGAGNKYPFGFYLFLILLLIVGEVLMWRVFKLKKNPSAQKSQKEFIVFVVVTAVGGLLNFAILKYGTVRVPPQFGLNQQLWTNLINVFATAISLVWNFSGYKLLVFKK